MSELPSWSTPQAKIQFTMRPQDLSWWRETFPPVTSAQIVGKPTEPLPLSQGDEPVTKVYLAGSFSRKHELRDYREVIEALGFEVTSEWLDEEGEAHSVYAPSDSAAYYSYALRDLANIEESDIVVCFTSDDPTSPVVGGGRHFEAGYAYANSIPLVYVGKREHVFHYLNTAVVVPTVNDLYLWLIAYPDTYEFEERLASAGTWA